MAVRLEAMPRTGEKHSSIRKIRQEGNIPAILNGANKSEPIYINSIEFLKTIREAGRNGIINLSVNQEQHPVMIHEIQKDSIKGDVLHADFQIVNMSEKVEVEVGIHLVGDAIGVKDGGVLQQPLHQLLIKSLPSDIPQSIEVDISSLEVGATLVVGDLPATGAYEILQDKEQVVASILAPRQEEEISTGEEQEEGIPESVEGREEEPPAGE
ncbi:50S ribosomal protein L25/general stress protein Ctc [Bacillus sp. PS06]|uniref:50S ribosomal protein L25/general stress protein Ctc n=1 Tax=Bacillus sp. PS06 TaxID=2764176 RepID=UPI0017850F08|nr:50S ribosomal protein L25/general stress protein Ctc [Bacillus sp. PS06]MBD8071016.1 50S ribosomal protein L25/general stress protein Ctc [Bacillus sp. PS06]